MVGVSLVPLGKCAAACSDKRLSFEMPLSPDSLRGSARLRTLREGGFPVSYQRPDQPTRAAWVEKTNENTRGQRGSELSATSAREATRACRTFEVRQTGCRGFKSGGKREF